MNNKVKRLTDAQIVSAVIEAEVQLAIGLGYSDKMIKKHVAKVTKHDIYRISKQIGLRRRDYRDCDSPLGKFVWSKATTALRRYRSLKEIHKTTPKLLKQGWP